MKRSPLRDLFNITYLFKKYQDKHNDKDVLHFIMNKEVLSIF